jgi:hypothetical protein
MLGRGDTAFAPLVITIGIAVRTHPRRHLATHRTVEAAEQRFKQVLRGGRLDRSRG